MAFGLALLLFGCDRGGGTLIEGLDTSEDSCIIPTNLFADGGVGKDGIPSLENPVLVGADEVNYLNDGSRVIGLVVEGRAIAVPHNILWWHEIANFDLGGQHLAVTYCPLTGSSMIFDRSVVGGATFGVSGLLFQNNLTMYDRNRDVSLWPQMSRQSGCGDRPGTPLPMWAAMEMTWAGWQALYPDTEVVSQRTGFTRNYTPTGYPYGTYENPDNAGLLFDMPIDARRPPKERLLGIPGDDGGVAFPFGALDEGGPVFATHTQVDGDDIVVFWSRTAQGAMAYYTDGGRTFIAEGEQFVDSATRSTWRLDGRAIEGPEAGAQLAPVAEAYVAFWFAWAAFHPETRLWTGS